MNERPTAGRTAGDEGFTLIEVMVALLVFALVSTGVVAGVTQLLRMTDDNQARVTAANLASQELDTVRAISDVYSIQSVAARPIQVGDPAYPSQYRTYHLTRSVAWISAAGGSLSCNNSTDVTFLRVNVRVTWDGQLGTTAAVQDDTILSPTGGNSSSSTGAISISVYGADGAPVSGVSASVVATKGGAALASQPSPTTTEGCTYANDVTPGTYSVTLSKAGYLDDAQSASSSKSVTVTAGTTQSVSFTFDKALTLSTSYVAGPLPYSGTAAEPTNLQTNFINTSGTYTTTSPTSSITLFPFSSGYSAIAGPVSSGTTNCASVDPRAWISLNLGGVSLTGGTRPAKGGVAGGSAALSIGVGVVLVRASTGAALTATQASAVGTAGQGNPGCGVTGSTLSWSATGGGSTWVALALPYGSWTIKAAGSAVAASNLQVVTNDSILGVSSDGTVTLDPRALG